MSTAASEPTRSVAVITLGCARNEVDSEELAGRLREAGWALVDDPAQADVALVNTCGFIEQAKKDSIDALLEAADLKATGRTRAVVAVGCLAERYGEELATQLPEADAVLGFDSYDELSAHLGEILGGAQVPSHVPRDRRQLLPLAPRDRAATAHHHHGHVHGDDLLHGHAHGRPGVAAVVEPAKVEPAPPGRRPVRVRLDDRPWAPVKIAGGCDRRCAFCAIPTFRGAYQSRPPEDVLAEAQWLAEQGVRELFLVSENSTSYGKDLGDLRLLEKLLPQLAGVDGIRRVRVSYLQPAELRPALVDAMATTPGVVPYYDVSFQHASASLLRRMRRFGSREAFLELLGRIRQVAPEAGIRSNVIVGFPGETETDLQELELFLTHARLDVVGVFGYSDEEGTEAVSLDGHLPEDVVADRVSRITALVEELTAQRAEERVGERVEVLVEEVLVDPAAVSAPDEDDEPRVVGRAAFQGPDVDGTCDLIGFSGTAVPRVGDLVGGVVVGTDGVDLIVEVD